MKDKIMTFLFLLLTNVAQKITINRGAYREIAHLKLKLLYLRAIKACRLLCISYFVTGICLVLLFSSLVLFHATFFLYAPYSMETKMWVGFVFAAAYLLVAVKAFLYVFTEGKWLNIFYAQNIFKELDA